MKIEKRKLSELRVVDLRNELSKRKLDTTGLKPSLVKRLRLVRYTEPQNSISQKFCKICRL